MTSLLLTIVTIVLSSVLVVATLYHTNAIDKSAKAAAAGLVENAAQIYSARTLEYQDKGFRSDALAVLVSSNYLDSLSIPPGMAYASVSGESGPAPRAQDWSTEANQGPGIFLAQKISERVCREVNLKMAGTDEIFSQFNPAHVAHCYGTAEPYTFVYGARTGLNNDSSTNTEIPEGARVSPESTVYLDAPDTDVSVLSGQPVAVRVTNETCEAAELVAVLPAPGFESSISVPTQTGPTSCENRVLQPEDWCEVTVTPIAPLGTAAVSELLLDLEFATRSAETLNRDAACPSPVANAENSTTQIPLKVSPFKAGVPTPDWATRYWVSIGGVHHDIASVTSSGNFGRSWRHTQTARDVVVTDYKGIAGLGGFATPNLTQTELIFQPRPTESSLYFGTPSVAPQSGVIPGRGGLDTFFNHYSSQAYGAKSYPDYGSVFHDILKYRQNGGVPQVLVSAAGQVLFAGVDSVWQPTPGGPHPIEAVTIGSYSFSPLYQTVGSTDNARSYLVTPYQFPAPAAAKEIHYLRADTLGGDFLVHGEDGTAWVSGISYAVGPQSLTYPCNYDFSMPVNMSLARALDAYTPGSPGECGSTPGTDFLMKPAGGVTWYTHTSPVVATKQAGTLSLDMGYGPYQSNQYSEANYEVFKKRTAHLLNAVPAVTAQGTPLTNIVRIATFESFQLGGANGASCALALDASGIVWGAGATVCWGGPAVPFNSSTVPPMQAGFTPVYDFSAYPKAVDIHRAQVYSNWASFMILREDGTLVQLRRESEFSIRYSPIPIAFSGGNEGLRFFRIDCSGSVNRCVGLASDGRVIRFDLAGATVTDTPTLITVTPHFYSAGCAQKGQPLVSAACPVFTDVKIAWNRIYTMGADGIVYAGATSSGDLANGHGGRFNNATYSSTAFTDIDGLRRLFPLMTTNLGEVAPVQVSGGYTMPRVWVVDGRLLSFQCTGSSCSRVFLNYRR